MGARPDVRQDPAGDRSVEVSPAPRSLEPRRGDAKLPRPVRRWRADQRPVVIGGLALTAILLFLVGTTVDPPTTAISHPKFVEIERNARLFHDLIPHVLSLPLVLYAVLTWVAVLGLWLVYLGLLWRVRDTPLDLRIIAGGGLLLALLALLIPPVFSTDIFSYAIFGRLAGVHGLNPYLVSAAEGAPGDPIAGYLYWEWRSISSPYGPLWTLVSSVLAQGEATTPLAVVLRFKLLSFVAVVVSGWFVYRFVRHGWPKRAVWAYLAFAWNPLVLVEGIVAGHNDVLILAIVLAAAYLALCGRVRLSFAGLTLSGLIKYSTLPVLGVAGLRLLLRTPPGRRAGLVAALSLIGGVLAVAAYAPYWAGLAGFTSVLHEPGRGVNNPVMLFVRGMLSFMTAGHLRMGVPLTVALSLLAFCAWQIVALWRFRWESEWTIHGELAAWAVTLTVFLLLWPRIHTWYFVVPFGLALAAGPTYRRTFTVILVVSFLSYASYGL